MSVDIQTLVSEEDEVGVRFSISNPLGNIEIDLMIRNKGMPEDFFKLLVLELIMFLHELSNEVSGESLGMSS